MGCGNDAPLRPDLVLITVDRLATDRLPCFEGENDPGDAICALADGGTLFAWTAASGAGEASAAASVLTGLPPVVHGVADDGRSFLRDPLISIAEELGQSGYSTAAFVASPRVNRSRRLDQGFALYDDRFASRDRSRLGSGDERATLDRQVRAWFERTESPRFAWIHLDRDAGQVQLDRLVSRLATPLEKGAQGPGIIFAGLRGEIGGAETSEGATTNASTERAFSEIEWRSHRVPLIWRPPAGVTEGVPRVSRRLASLYDIAPTLRAAARLAEASDTEANAGDATPAAPRGRDLSQLRGPGGRSEADDSNGRFYVLLEAAGDQVGLAAEHHLYVRQRSPLDGTGRPVPTTSLELRGARFSTIEAGDPLFEGRPRTARLDFSGWRADVLSSDSPVPQLEYHLARRLDRLPETPTP